LNSSPLINDLLLMQLLDAGVEGLLAFDRDCRYTVWNKAMELVTGLSREEVLGRSAFDLFPFLKETGEDKCYYSALAGESSTSEKRPYTIPETSREGFFKAYYSPLFNLQNEVVGGIAVVHDITERKRAEEAVQKAHQRLAFHVDNSPLAVIEWDSEFRVSRWSESAERLYGWKASEVSGKHVSDWHFVFDEDVDAVAQLTHRQRVGVELQGIQHNRNYTKDGSILYCEWYNSVLHDDSGKLVSVLSLVLDVTSRKLAEEERGALLARERDLRKQAEQADRLKDEFLATLSHELRTPLTSILGWATLIRNGEVDQAQNLDRALEIIERNARSQARLIDDLLDVSRIITGNLQLDVRPLNVAPIVKAAIEALRPAAAAKGIQVQIHLDPESCLVSGDPNRLRQVVWNLLMNAIKFTPRSGKVDLNLECVETGARLTVRDNGDGIGAEFLPYVFHRFRQEEGSISRKAGGLGLGLAVVRHLVELHGGSVSAESPGPGRGSTFTVDLPLAADRRDAQTNFKRESFVDGIQKSDNQPVIGRRSRDRIQAGIEVPLSGDDSDGRHGSFSPGKLESTGVALSSENGAQLAGISVLLVEDDDDSRNLLSLVLQRYGARVVPAASSSEALDFFVREPPSIVISDIGMAEEDGYELIRKLRSLPVQGSLLASPAILIKDASLTSQPASLPAPVPAIALTGYATVKDRDRALSAGYQMHLAKPIEPEDLVAAILSLIGK
jgi:PAS domain S-box-containing protein